jgi:hypothetical protein
LNFGLRQDTKQADCAGQKPLFCAKCLFCNRDIWAKKVSFLLYPSLLLAPTELFRGGEQTFKKG